MKKLIVTLFFLFLAIHSYKAFDVNNCMQNIFLNDLNSKNVLNYLKENDLFDKVTKICSEDMCADINVSNLEGDIKDFIKQNIKYLKNKGENYSLEAELKGFKIAKISFNSCL